MEINNKNELIYYIKYYYPNINIDEIKFYYDYDGVIKDTFQFTVGKIKKQAIEEKWTKERIDQFLLELDWINIIKEAPEIDESYYVLRQLNPKRNIILTKCASGIVEAYAKKLDLKNNLVKLEMITLPLEANKHEIVDPKGNLLVEDTVKNALGFEENGGIGIFFDTDGDQIDEWHQKNETLPTIRSLKMFL